MQFDDAKKRSKAEKNQVVVRKESEKQVSFFSHLQQYDELPSFSSIKFDNLAVHPAIIDVALRFRSSHVNAISGANARCVAMLEALKCVVVDLVVVVVVDLVVVVVVVVVGFAVFVLLVAFVVVVLVVFVSLLFVFLESHAYQLL